MTLLALLAAVPCLFWAQGVETAPSLKEAGVTHLCVAPAQVDAWRAAGFSVVAVSDAEFAARKETLAPGVRNRADRASATRSPWLDANGWFFRRAPEARYAYELRAGRAALAAAEAYAYGVDAALKIDPGDLASLGAMQAFLSKLPASDLPDVADLGVVDDGTDLMAEVLNLFSRRNLLYRMVPAPSPQFKVNVKVGTAEYTLAEAKEPSDLALKVRRQLGDANRSLRLFGSEVVIGRLAGAGGRARLHLLNYGGRDIEGLRVRLRGRYPKVEARVAGVGAQPVADLAEGDGATEFTLPRLTAYGVLDLSPAP
jgi:hypothetical protein